MKSISTESVIERQSYLIRTYALFRIVDSKFATKVLEKAPNYEHFHDRVDDWIADNRERWKQVQSRLAYCSEMERKGQLGTPIDAEEPDVRWELFIKNGLPAHEIVLPCICRMGARPCSLWTYTWLPGDVGQQGHEASCQSRQGESYPTEIVPNDKESFPLAHPLWPIVNISAFPDAAGTTDLWVSIWVPGSQFTRPTLDSGLLRIDCELYDSSRSILLTADSNTCNLRVLRGLLVATEREDRHLIRAMGYMGFAGVKPGSYAAHLKVSGDRYNEGDEWLEVSVAQGSKISSLLLSEQISVSGGDLSPGIVRGDELYYFDNPEGSFIPGENMALYAEALLPDENRVEFQVHVSMLPLPDIPGRRKGQVSLGKTIVLSDSLNRPFTSGEFRSGRDAEVLQALDEVEPDPITVTLLRKDFVSPGGLTKIEVSPTLKNNLKSGLYMLTLTLSDPNSRSFFLSTRRLIRIASHRSR